MIGTERSPSERAWRARPGEAVDTAHVKRNAWILAALAIGFYLGFIAWNLWRSTAGG
jgi:hypothetical protein